MKSMHYLAAFVLLFTGTAAMANMLDVNLNNNTAQFQFSTANGVEAQGNADLHAGLLYNNRHSVLVNGGIMVANTLEGAPGVSIGVGMELLAATIKDNPPVRSDASAAALDALVRFSPAGAPQLGFSGEVHYAPNILTFGDAVRYTQGIVRVDYELAPQTMVYAGYRRISFGIKNGPAAVLDNGLHIGFKLAF
ncbi:MAG TPA: YfaZ family outer membrane protein [Gallionellaceae bacterium]|nr:YfaZ family outer membrane protein [Gallionellaceae bacterium]